MPSQNVSVFFPRGEISKQTVLQAGIAAVRSTLPPALNLTATIVEANRRDDDHEEPGTDFVIGIEYTERPTGTIAVDVPSPPSGMWGDATEQPEDESIDDLDEVPGV